MPELPEDGIDPVDLEDFEPEGLLDGDLDHMSRRTRTVFFEQLERSIAETQGYGGALLIAARTLEEHPLPASARRVELPELPPENMRAVERIVAAVRYAGLQSIVIEAGHVYNYHDVHMPTLEAALHSQFAQAAVVTNALRESGISVKEILFIDDYNPNPETGKLDEILDLEAYVELAHAVGYQPENIAYESDMAPLAEQLLMRLQQQGQVYEREPDLKNEREAKRGRQLLLRSRRIELFRPDDGPSDALGRRQGMYSCAMLDAALTLIKVAHLGEGVINVLPRRTDDLDFSYNSQQRKTRRILRKHLHTQVLPMMNFFTGDSPSDRSSVGHHHTIRPRRPQR
jgi:hypothetical protein